MTHNRLVLEKSPYLLQHANNPVDWYPWGEAAFEKARSENKPIFLSIGYATCHWCHVMEKESFEDEGAARYLNDTFVCIKVDREERPDIDAVYMTVCQMITGKGGWPLTVFMTADRQPFFAATYLPKNNRMGQPGLIEICQQVKMLWTEQQDRIMSSVNSISDALDRAFVYSGSDASLLDGAVLDDAYLRIERSFDHANGGFGGAPKFPTPHKLLFLLRYYHRIRNAFALEMITKTLIAMRIGGIFDHVGFGFHRYSTDNTWLLPHFEKMLYDQALLAMAYAEAYQVSGENIFSETVHEIFDYILSRMTSPEGAFYAAEDADSEGEEGKFYVWTMDEFQRVVGEKESFFWEEIFNIHDGGNYLDEATRKSTGANILHLRISFAKWAKKKNMKRSELKRRWNDVRQKLFAEREKRVHPLLDDKILTDWNGLMIAALAKGGMILERQDYIEAAERAVRFILDRMVDGDGRLLHRYRDNEAGIVANAGDYAYLVLGLIQLYEATVAPEYLVKAIELQERMIQDFWDDADGGFFLSAETHKELPVRPKELYDGAMPSANSASFLNLLMLSKMTGNPKWAVFADKLAAAFSEIVKSQPEAFTYCLMGVDFINNPGRETVIVGEPDAPETSEMLRILSTSFLPNTVWLLKSRQNEKTITQIAEYTEKMEMLDEKTTCYVCSDYSCQQPVVEPSRLIKMLKTFK